MFVRKWFHSLSRSFTAKSTYRTKRGVVRHLESRRLLLEGLEDRQLMAFDVLAEYATAHNPRDLALTQIDGGSQPDLVVVNSNNSIDFRAGNASGTFGSPLNSPTGAGAHTLAAGDFNGDDVTDVVTANSDSLSLLIGNGDGSFQPPMAISLPRFYPTQFPPELSSPQPQWPSSVATGDLNGDGNLDLVVAGLTTFWDCPYGCYPYYDGYVNVLIGNGSGSFAAPDVQHIDRFPGSIAVGDLNNDDLPDVIATNGNGLSAFMGDGTGAVGSPIHSGSGSGLLSLSLGDIDGDGNLDTITRSGDSLIVQKGQGNGSFLPSTSVNTDHPIHSAVVGDVNGDGTLDLVAVGTTFTCTLAYYYCDEGYSTRQATVAIGTGQGGFSSPITSVLGTGPYNSSSDLRVALADLTGDGLPELVAIDQPLNLAVVAKGNWPPPDAPFISIDSSTLVEGNAGSVQVSMTVRLSAPYTNTVTADFHTADGGAQAGSDYQSKSGSLTFAPGVTQQTITMLVYGDRLNESDESFSVILTNVVNATVGNHGAVSILENEPRISINHPYSTDPLTVIEGDVGTTPAVFTVTLAMPYDQEVTVDYSTLTGHINDIVATAGTLRFAPGETSKTITVQVVGDWLDEPREAFNVNLTGSSPNAAIVVSGGYCYIEDNDPSTITIRDASTVEGNSGTKLMTFVVSLSNASGQGVWVNYATANGSATTSDNDYLAKSGTIYFAPGETSKTITVTIKGDTKKENDEKFYVNLSGASGATIADSQGVGTIVNDDGAGKGNTKGSKQALSASAVDAAIDELLLPEPKKRR